MSEVAGQRAASTAGTQVRQKGKKRVDSSIWVMGGLTLVMVIWAYAKGADLPLRGFQTTFELLQDVWLPLLLGFCLAGFFDVLVPRELLVRWMGEQSGWQGIFIGWLIGLAMPGGPYVVFPIAASLFKQGVGVGPLITFITAKSLLSPTRLFSWEVPFLGWPFVAARAIPSFILPPLVGIVSQRLFAYFNR
ncbi:MAG TPA: permease [Candidatus Binatia bacterium]|nr:permease [Candidatus Binatia bacterium]